MCIGAVVILHEWSSCSATPNDSDKTMTLSSVSGRHTKIHSDDFVWSVRKDCAPSCTSAESKVATYDYCTLTTIL